MLVHKLTIVVASRFDVVAAILVIGVCAVAVGLHRRKKIFFVKILASSFHQNFFSRSFSDFIRRTRV